MDSRHNSAPADDRKLSVQPVTSPRGFVFPSLYSFPPFFTQVRRAASSFTSEYLRICQNSKQPNEQTWAHQCAQWTTLILAYSRFHKLYRLELTDETCAGELFYNKDINRTGMIPSA
jgi:ESCRT-II complex subunit VPS25